MENRSVTIVWEDEDNVLSFLPALEWYDLELLRQSECDIYKTEITVYGPTKNIEAFLADFEEGCVEPLERLSRQNEFDEDYMTALNSAVAACKGAA